MTTGLTVSRTTQGSVCLIIFHESLLGFLNPSAMWLPGAPRTLQTVFTPHFTLTGRWCHYHSSHLLFWFCLCGIHGKRSLTGVLTEALEPKSEVPTESQAKHMRTWPGAHPVGLGLSNGRWTQGCTDAWKGSQHWL